MLGLNQMGLTGSRPLGVGGFSIASLFASGEQGVWYDPSDFSTMFQDSSGTTPVTAVGQPVGRILDKSGRGNHATQATAASQPVLQQDANGLYYLLFDGSNDSLTSSTLTASGVDKAQLFTGHRKSSLAGIQCLVEMSDASSNTGGYINHFATAGTTKTNAGLSGSVNTTGLDMGGTDAIANYVTAIVYDLTGADRSTEILPRVNGAVPTLTGTNAFAAGGGTFNSHPLYIGRRGGSSFPFNGRLYSLILRFSSTNLDASTVSSVESYVNSMTQAY